MKDSNHFKAGLLIVVSFLIAVGLFFGITGSSLFLGKSADYTAVFDLTEDVGGLESGNEVRLGGVKVGTVRAVEIVDRDDKQQVVAVFRIPEKYALKQNATVAVQTGLTGMVNLNITNLGQGARLTRADPIDGSGSSLNLAIEGLGDISDALVPTINDVRQTTIPKVNSAIDKADKALTTADASAEQIRVAAATADDTLKQVRSKVDPVIERYNAVADAAKTAMENFGLVFGDTRADFRATLANLTQATAAFKDKLPPLLDRITAAVDNIDAGVTKSRGVLEDIDAIAKNTREATGSVRSILTTNRSRIDDIVKHLNLTSQNASAASSEIRRSPWRLLYTPKSNEVANQNLFDAARRFAEGSSQLQDSATALRDLSKDANASPAQVQKLLDQLQSDFKKYEQVEKQLWEQVQK